MHTLDNNVLVKSEFFEEESGKYGLEVICICGMF